MIDRDERTPEIWNLICYSSRRHFPCWVEKQFILVTFISRDRIYAIVLNMFMLTSDDTFSAASPLTEEMDQSDVVHLNSR